MDIYQFNLNVPFISYSKTQELIGYFSSIHTYKFYGLNKQLLYLVTKNEWYQYNDIDLHNILMNNDYIDLYSHKLFFISFNESFWLVKFDDQYSLAYIEANQLFISNKILINKNIFNNEKKRLADFIKSMELLEKL